ncbi:NACHT domain protein [Xylaria venustula]|nr:NACHT domain protein [Xylaria venustula]
MAASLNPVEAAFENSMRDFKAELKDAHVYNQLSQITTIDQVYDATDEIQRKQAKEGHLRHLSKISPYLDRLAEYAATIEVFVQVKPDILALIWGPIKLLLQWTSIIRASFDAIIDIMAEIGELLPEFKRVISLFDQTVALQEVMALFFRDILDFYLVALKFFKLSRWKYLFESLWPTHKEKIKIVMTHIQNHGRLMRNEVRLEHIQQEYEARRLALQNFERLELERRAQEFHRIKTDIAPQSHDDRLDLLRHLTYPGTGAWLLQDAMFKKWADSVSQDSRILWLQGIPGAGKTYLASEVIKKTQSLGYTAFVFLSYKNKESLSAISVVHSLVFHLASGHDDLQTVICQSCSDECKKTLEGATRLLLAVLACTGPAYLIIDGLDEIGEIERCRLITELVQVSKSSPETRIFISSRPEADLVSKLCKSASVLQIDNKNHQCIQTFVRKWTKSWFVEREFWPEEQTEIQQGLESLASKSKGMFLYARVVLDGIKFLDNFGDIRDELHALPETLDDAYGRILRRINNLDNRGVRDKARLVLGWIGCSPAALTVQEIQQALSIDLQDPEKIGNVRGNLDLVRMCGPIVELVDGFVQFVHFTVKEYIFSDSILGFIDIQRAALDLTLRCITYLLQGHHELDLSHEDIRLNILSGQYTMEWLATNIWPQLAKMYLSSAGRDERQQELGIRLEILHTARSQAYPSEDHDLNSMLPDLDNFQQAYPQAFALLDQALRFRQTCTGSEHRMHPRAPWLSLDPLTTSRVSVRIHQAMQTVLAGIGEDGHRYGNIIQRRYGQRPHKCQYLSCHFNRIGFEDFSQVQSHENSHQRPWKCSVKNCEYEDGGFLTEKMRDDHLDRAHSTGNSFTVDLTQLSDEEENRLLLLDLVKMGCVNSVITVLSQMDQSKLKSANDMWKDAVPEAAVRSGLLPMVKLWFPKPFRVTSDTIISAIQVKNPAILEYLLNNYEDRHCTLDALVETISSGDHNLIHPWVNWIRARPIDRRGSGYPHCVNYLRSLRIIRLTANDASLERMLIALWMAVCWSQHNPEKEKSYFGVLLGRVAATTCSVTLARHLLDSGAEVDYRRTVRYFTPLRLAAKRDTAEAAALMKLLLSHGANPDIEQEPRTLSEPVKSLKDEKGPLGISKWLGITWDELLKEVRGNKSRREGG